MGDEENLEKNQQTFPYGSCRARNIKEPKKRKRGEPKRGKNIFEKGEDFKDKNANRRLVRNL